MIPLPISRPIGEGRLGTLILQSKKMSTTAPYPYPIRIGWVWSRRRFSGDGYCLFGYWGKILPQ